MTAMADGLAGLLGPEQVTYIGIPQLKTCPMMETRRRAQGDGSSKGQHLPGKLHSLQILLPVLSAPRQIGPFILEHLNETPGGRDVSSLLNSE